MEKVAAAAEAAEVAEAVAAAAAKAGTGAAVTAATAAAATTATSTSEMDLSGDGCNDTAMGGAASSTKQVGFPDPAPSPAKKKSTSNDMDIEVIDMCGTLQTAKNTALNASLSCSAGIYVELKPPVWKLSKFQKRHTSVQAIKHAIWKKIKPLQKIEDIDKLLDSPKLKHAWLKSTTNEFARDIPVSTIKTFVSILLKNKEDWTSSQDGRYVYHDIFCDLSRTSPEIFGGVWKRTGKLQPSPIASWWTAAIEVLG